MAFHSFLAPSPDIHGLPRPPHGFPEVPFGKGLGRITNVSNRELAQRRVVFAVGRSAIEALGIGCQVILAGPEGVGELVKIDNWRHCAKHNFALTAKKLPCHEPSEELVAEGLQEALAIPLEERRQLQGEVAAELSLSAVAASYLALYHEALAERGQWNPRCVGGGAASEALSRHLQRWEGLPQLVAEERRQRQETRLT